MKKSPVAAAAVVLGTFSIVGASSPPCISDAPWHNYKPLPEAVNSLSSIAPANEGPLRRIQDLSDILAERIHRSTYMEAAFAASNAAGVPRFYDFPGASNPFWATSPSVEPGSGPPHWVVDPHASFALDSAPGTPVIEQSGNNLDPTDPNANTGFSQRQRLLAPSLWADACEWTAFLSARGFDVSGGNVDAFLGNGALLAQVFGPSLNATYRMNGNVPSAQNIGIEGARAHDGRWPRGIEPSWGISPGDFPPLANSPAASTSPLVPLQSIGSASSAMYAERVVEGESLDLLTGQPLLREVDLELPFGSAVFRHVRTYSELPRFASAPSDGRFRDGETHRFVREMDTWWNWHGSNWMMSENPLFLIDAEYGGGEIAPFGPRRCYFIPDAHHSIPFEMMEIPGGNPRYVAPAWFDADLTYDGGTWDDTLKIWTDPPTRFYVRLFGGDITYEIEPYYEDVVRQQPITTNALDDAVFHAMLEEVGHETLEQLKAGSPSVPDQLLDGLGAAGVPYYGLVDVIRDRAGNRIEMTYDQEHQPRVHPVPTGTTGTAGDFTGNELIHRFMQMGYRKGMIKEVRLYPAGAAPQDDPAWTLLYTYRTFLDPVGLNSRFPGDDDQYGPDPSTLTPEEILNESHFWDSASVEPALHSIVVYEGAPDAPNRPVILDACRVGDAEQPGDTPFVDLHHHKGSGGLFMKPRCGTHATPFDYQDAEIGPAGEGGDASTWTALPKDWSHILQYSYSEPHAFSYESDYTVEQTEPHYLESESYYAASLGDLQNHPDGSNLNIERVEAYQLLRVQAKRRINADDPSGFDSIDRYWMYRYQDVGGKTNGNRPMLRVNNQTSEFPSGYASNIGWYYELEAYLQPKRLKYRFGPQTVDRMIAGWRSQQGLLGIGSGASWFATDSQTESEYVNGVISAADWDGVAWTVNHASVGRPDTIGVMPFEEPLVAPEPVIDPAGDPIRIGHRTLAIHYLADRTFYGWNQEFPLTAPESPEGYVHPLWEKGTVPATRWFRENLDTEPVEMPVLASWKSFWEDGQHADIRANYLGKQYEGDSASAATLAPNKKVGFLPGGAAIYGEGAGDNAVYRRVYRFIRTPDSDAWRNGGGQSPDFANYPGPEVILPMLTGVHSNARCTRALYRYPYRFTRGDAEDSSDVASYGAYDFSDSNEVSAPAPGQVPLDEIMWWTVVDEFDSIDDVRAGFDGWTSRRIVGLNAAGRLLLDQRWLPGSLQSTDGVLQRSYVYDLEGRLVEERSRGWAAALRDPADLGADNGLITVYNYVEGVRTGIFDADGRVDPDLVELNPSLAEPPSLLVANIEVQKGAGTQQDPASRTRLRSMEYDQDDGVMKETVYGYTTGEILSESEVDTVYVTSGTGEDEEKIVSRRTTMEAGIEVSPTSGLLRPFQTEIYGTDGDDRGRLIWRVRGLLADPANPGASSDDQVYIDYTSYDSQGRTIFEVVDIDLSGSRSSGGDVQMIVPNLRVGTATDPDFTDHPEIPQVHMALLAPYTRAADPASDPLNLVTYSTYNDFGRTMLVEPNGVRTITDWREVLGVIEQLEAAGVTFDENGDPQMERGSRMKFAGASAESIEQYDYDGTVFDGIPFPEIHNLGTILNDVVGESCVQLRHLTSTLTPSYDSSGRVSGIEVTSPDLPGETLSSYVFKDGWGNVLRSQNADGDVTRHTYDWLGRLHKTFRGTQDTNPVWRGVNLPDVDDMVLTERLAYGTGSNDAFLPVKKWMFNAVSPQQYTPHWMNGDWNEPSGDSASASAWTPGAGAETTSGVLESYGYDWRMRRVSTKESELDAPGTPFRETIQWLDNADRVRFSAVFDGAAAGAPSADIAPEDALPSAADILASTNIVSLTETLYNAAGQVQETRQYDVSSATPEYIATRTYHDHEGRPIWSQTGQVITKSLYDAQGRLIRSQRLVERPSHPGGFEISRTVNVFDQNGENTIDETYTWRRLDGVDPTTGEPLDLAQLAAQQPQNVEVSVVYNWYDTNRRVIAMADFGSIVPSSTVSDIDAFRASVAGLPARPTSAPDRTYNKVSGGQDVTATQWLDGYTYPGDPSNLGDPWFDAAGRAVAVFSFYDFDANGKQRSVLRTQECYTDGTELGISYTTEWTDHSAFGQPELTLTFGYETIPASQSAQNVTETIAHPPHGMAYQYEGSRLTDVATVLPEHFGDPFDPSVEPTINWGAADGSLQITRIEYGAPIIDANTPPGLNDGGVLTVSTRNDLVSAVYMPNPADGTPSTSPAYRYYYRPDGTLAGRRDARGVTLAYRHDAAGNTVGVEVIASNGAMEADTLLAGSAVFAPVGNISLSYDTLGRLRSAQTTSRADPQTVSSTSTLTLDSWGNILSEDFSNPVLSFLGARRVSYDWSVGAAALGAGSNTTRLNSITYPERPVFVGTWDGGPFVTELVNGTPEDQRARVVSYDYGPANGLDDLLDRVHRVTSTYGPAASELGLIAEYAYHGEGRLVEALIGERPCDPSGTVAGVLRERRDYGRFGQLSFQDVTSRGCDLVWAPDPILKAIHTHDEAGRRIFTRLRQADVTSPGDRDNIRSLLYEYDTFGRLTGAQRGTLSSLTGALDADVTLTDANPHTFAYNIDRLGNRVGGPGGEPGFSEFFEGLNNNAPVLAYTAATDERNKLTSLTDNAGTQPTTSYQYDAAGNLAQDARFEYHYDAFNRLVAIEDTEIVGTDQLVMAFAYDAFGRLITRVTPWDDLWGNTDYRIQTFWYDGNRRIEEIVVDPVHAVAPWELTPVQVGTPEVRIENEYFYAAHPGARTDELHAVVDWFDRIAYPMQDASNGTTLGFTSDEGEVVEQYSWSPFGRLLAVDEMPGITDAPSWQNGQNGGLYHDFRIGVGHHGLFAEALAEPGTTLQYRANPLRVGRTTVYHNRNRTYDPHLGRFFQHDPNGTGQTLAGLAAQGKLGWTAPSAFSSEAWFGDGGNLYAAYGHDPANVTDQSGLFSLPGLLLPSGETISIYEDYNDQALEGGMAASDYINAELSSYGADQLLAMELILDWDTPDAVLTAVGVGGILAKIDSHHVIPKFLLGIDDAANRVGLPRRQHRAYHKILREEFKNAGLPSPHSRGKNRWVTRLTQGDVSTEEVNKARRALMNAGRRFDKEVTPDFDVTGRTRLSLNAGLYKEGVLDVGRRARRRWR